jgi:Na+-translocating ferredoxin:NAD+ oxidoreductase RnfD subunit
MVIGWDAHQATAIGWMIQVLVLVGALFLLASRIRRRS